MQMSWDYAGAVVISGLVIVFVGLILLIIAVSIMGQVFKKLVPAISAWYEAWRDERRAKKNGGKELVPEPSIPIVPQPAPSAPAERTIPEQDDDEIIAVIAAAVAAISAETGEGLRIRSIRPKRQGGHTNAWATAAARESVQ
ncbi:MAG: OadG family protein [Oscillospiraceae bacterium]|nr:OadG family protein [Oscillospiraceae bacterium]